MTNERKRFVTTRIATMLLNAVSMIAEKNATSACRGLLHEPKVPKKLQEKK